MVALVEDLLAMCQLLLWFLCPVVSRETLSLNKILAPPVVDPVFRYPFVLVLLFVFDDLRCWENLFPLKVRRR